MRYPLNTKNILLCMFIRGNFYYNKLYIKHPLSGLMRMLLFALLMIPFAFAQLSINLYQESEGFSKDYGDIDAKPGDHIRVFIEAENENTDRNADEINNIEVSM